jgi:hypothetical protein
MSGSFGARWLRRRSRSGARPWLLPRARGNARRLLEREPGLIVHKVYNGYWFLGRPSAEELRQDLRAILMKIHWDWDLSSPEVRPAWERGERNRFYPPELGWPRGNSGQ